MFSGLKRWLREPLLHFLVLGVGLFLLYGSLRPSRDGGEAERRIDITSTEVAWLAENWKARWLRPPTETELRGLVQDYVRQEVFYREALRMGLDRDDEVIRQRMVQKIEFLTEDLAAQAAPAEGDLQAFYRENLDRYRIPERRSFAHIYFNSDRRGHAAAVAAAEQTLAGLPGSPDAPIRAAELGDRFMLQHEFRALSQVEVERLFGPGFATALFDLEPGGWQGPVVSSYGVHLARVAEVVEAAVPEFAAVRDEVLRDFAVGLKERASEAMYSSLAGRYEIDIDEEAIRNLSMSGGSPGAGQ
jgi:hypothetical protein